MDSGTLAERVADIRKAQEKIANNDKLASAYLAAVEDRRNKAAMAEALQEGVNTHYDKLETAFTNRNENPQVVGNEAKQVSAAVLNAYVEDSPEQKEVFQPYLDLLKYEEDVTRVIQQSNYPTEEKLNLLKTLFDMHNQVNSKEEAAQFLENVIDNPDIADNVKQQYNDLLKGLSTLGYQRNATVLRKREEEERKKKAKIEAAKKKEKEAKEQAEIAAEEA